MSASLRPRNDAPSGNPGEDAARWHERMNRSDVSDDTRAAFERWRRIPAHSRAYEAVERAWSAARSAAEHPAILALRHETALRLTRKSWRWPAARAGIAAAIVLTLGVLLPGPARWFSGDSTTQVADGSVAERLLERAGILDGNRYATATGERLVVSLPDGSRVTLNTRSEVHVDYSDAERSIGLVRGQALFEVAKDPGRPFVVEARGRRLVAIGTSFDVRIDGRRVQVTMIEGTVAVERSTSSPHRKDDALPDAAEKSRALVATLSAGDQLMVDGEHLDRVRVADPRRVTSWQKGQVIFENERLAEAIAELNRYSDTQIRLADAALGDLRLSGAFVTGRQTVFIEAVSSYFPVEASRGDDGSLVLGPAR